MLSPPVIASRSPYQMAAESFSKEEQPILEDEHLKQAADCQAGARVAVGYPCACRIDAERVIDPIDQDALAVHVGRAPP